MTIAESEIFDASQYDLPIPARDGYKADKLIVNMNGTLELDRTSEEDLAFIEGLKLGREVTLSVVATVTKGGGFTFTPGKDENPPTVAYGVGLRVHSLELDGEVPA